MTVDYYLTICMEVSLSYSFSLGSLWEPLHIPPRHCGLQAKGGRQVVQSRLSKNRYSNQDVLHHLQSHNTHCSGWRRPLRANLSAILHIFSNSKIEKTYIVFEEPKDFQRQDYGSKVIAPQKNVLRVDLKKMKGTTPLIFPRALIYRKCTSRMYSCI
jgi:hypothetical protein